MADSCDSWFDDCSDLKKGLTYEQLFRLLITKDANGCPTLRTAASATFTPSSTRRTPTRVTVNTNGSVAAGARSVTFETSGDFQGTILGVAASPNSVYTYGVNQNDDDLAEIAYTITAGSIIINKVA